MAKVLIVDDAAFMRMMLKNILEKNGHEVLAEAGNGREAIEKFRSLLAIGRTPDFITMDITMPDMNGIEAVKKIKEIEPSAKIIMCSAMGQQAMVLDAIKSGASDFIVKPFEEERVVTSISKVLGNA